MIILMVILSSYSSVSQSIIIVALSKNNISAKEIFLLGVQSCKLFLNLTKFRRAYFAV